MASGIVALLSERWMGWIMVFLGLIAIKSALSLLASLQKPDEDD